MNNKRSLVPLALVLLLSACSDPQAVVIIDFKEFAKTGESTIVKLEAEDQTLFRRFVAEYQLGLNSQKEVEDGVEFPAYLSGKTVGAVLELARAYFSAKDGHLAKTTAEAEAGALARIRTYPREYSGAAEDVQPIIGGDITKASHAIEDEVARGGPRGEVRIFEDFQEKVTLTKGASPKYLNGQFRYYLASVDLTQPKDSGCKYPLLAIRLAVESLHGTPTSSIYGKFTFTQTLEGTAKPTAEPLGVPYYADLIGPFSEKQGGVTYITAYLSQTNSIIDVQNWGKIAAAHAARRTVWFAPEIIYYPGGDQYSQKTGRAPASRRVLPCGGDGGGEPAVALSLQGKK